MIVFKPPPQKKKKNQWLYHFFNLQNHPTFDSEVRLVNLERGREGFILYTFSLWIERTHL